MYCHRFDILIQSSRIYFVACTIGMLVSWVGVGGGYVCIILNVNSASLFFCVAPAYGVGLLITFVALAVMQMGQPALLYLVPCTLLTSLAVALCRKELPQFWTGSGFVVNTSLI